MTTIATLRLQEKDIATILSISKSSMKPILNKEMVLEFAKEQKKNTDEMPGNTTIEIAEVKGRLDVLNDLLDLILNTI